MTERDRGASDVKLCRVYVHVVHEGRGQFFRGVWDGIRWGTERVPSCMRGEVA